MVYILLGTGFEEIEAIAPGDILRRGGVPLQYLGVGGAEVSGAHGIRICADAELGELSLKAGDTLQASGRQSPIVIIRGVTSEGSIDVMPPSEGWAGGRYKLLSTTSAGLSFTLQGADGLEVAYGSETANEVVTYYADVKVPGEVQVACEEELLSPEAENTPLVALNRQFMMMPVK